MLKEKTTITFLLAMIFLFTTLISKTGANPAATIQVEPSASTQTIGETFSINIKISGVIGLTCWEFKLYFNNAVLNCIDAVEGPFLLSGGETFCSNATIDKTAGMVLLGCTLLGMDVQASGTGVLATVTFKAKTIGDATLHLQDTNLGDTNVPPQPISHTTKDGTVHVELVPGHDVAVTEIACSKTVICQGCSAAFNVTVQNQGLYTETLDATLYADTTLINTQTVTLTSSSSEHVMFTWHTINSPLTSCTMKAEVITNEDIDPADNILTETIPVSIKGDINADGKVNILDISQAAIAFGSKLGEPKWDSNPDLNEDQQINILDIATIAIEFGKTRPL